MGADSSLVFDGGPRRTFNVCGRILQLSVLAVVVAQEQGVRLILLFRDNVVSSLKFAHESMKDLVLYGITNEPNGGP